MNEPWPKCFEKAALIISGLFLLILILLAVVILPERTTPILMYHSISSPEGWGSGNLDVPVDRFAKQMQYLADHNYEVVSLEKLAAFVRSGKKIPPRWVVLTFDDGHRDFYTQAYPILKKHGFPATIFVAINWIERLQSNISWAHLKRLAHDESISIGSHTISHSLLPLLSPEEAKQEIGESKRILEEKIGRPIASFAYPAGAVSESIKEMVQEAGYEYAVGTTYQKGKFRDNDVYLLRRVIVTQFSQYPLVFRLMISGYYTPAREWILRIFNIKTPRKLHRTAEYAR